MRKLFSTTLLIGVLACSAGADADREHQVKAAFIANFVKFIEWPDLQADGSKFVVGVYGADPFGNEIENALAGKSVAGHPIVVSEIHGDSEIRDCRMVVSGASSEDRINKLVKLCTASSTVLVGEAPDFARFGGTIGFEVVASKVRFDINLDTAKRSRIAISSKLLSLARTVYKQ